VRFGCGDGRSTRKNNLGRWYNEGSGACLMQTWKLQTAKLLKAVPKQRKHDNNNPSGWIAHVVKHLK